jgi:hypothetical protein
MNIKNYDEFVNEANVITSVKNKLKRINKEGVRNKKEEVKGLLRALVNMNDGIEVINGGVKIYINDNIYYLYTNGKVVFPQENEFYIDEEDVKILFYDFIKKK